MSTTLIFQDYHYGGKIANYKMGSIIKYKNKYQISYFGNIGMLVENAKNLTEAKKRLDIISETKIKKQGLKAPAKKKTIKTKKSAACSKVLKLMDKDYSYQKALKEVLNSDKRLNKKKLETELNNYI